MNIVDVNTVIRMLLFFLEDYPEAAIEVELFGLLRSGHWRFEADEGGLGF